MSDTLMLPTSLRYGYFDCSIFGDLTVSPERTRRLFEIEYYLENGRNTFSNGVSYRIKRHHVLIGRPGEKCNSELPFRTKFLKFEVAGILADILSSLPTYFPAFHTYEIEKHFDALIALGAQKDADPLLIQSNLLSLLSFFIKDGKLSQDAESGIARSVEKAKNYIHAHYTEQIKLSDIASAANLSPSYFHSLFTSHTGITPHTYVTECRIAGARELLCATSLSIEEIAEKCGFGSQQYMTNVFKKHLSISPGKCRKNNRESYLN
ncbi:MAG: helix-turn-helix transcriptional regulator [Ruminococcaceae bacterium]|nr:helix-turn-helix transcriptional regulator [Oscillospiraceae bacterium]